MVFQKAFYTSAVLLITCQLFSVHSEKCLVNRQEEIAKKYINYEGKSLALTLETSRRPSHRIVTNIFKIFVQEVLSYPHVNIIDQTDQFNITSIYMKIGNVSMDKEEYINNMRAMINLEVWVPLQEDTEIYVEHYNILERGGIGVSGRFGWFIPQQLLKHIYNLSEYSSDHIDDIHWTLLTNESFTSHFDIDVSQIIKQSVEIKNPFTYSCKSPYCKDGMFIPTQCEDSHKCAVLLAPYYEDTHFLIEHIKQLNLLVKVIWLGSNLQSTYDILMNMSLHTANKAFLMFGWTPSEIITPEKDFVYVSFPNCKIINSTESVGCKYEINRLLKVSWSKLKSIAKPVYDALQDFTFTTEDYEDLFHRYKISNNKSDYDIACHWIRDKENVIMKTWKPRANNIKIHIGGIFPFQGNRGSVSDTAHGIVVAAKMAKTAVNKSPLLQGYELNMLQFDGKCKSDQVMKSFIDYVRSPHYDDLVGILGPACSETVEPLAGVSKFFKTIIISYSAEGVSFSDRKKYPYFFRTVGENKHFIPVYQSLFKKLNWKRIAALTEDGQKYTEYVSHLQDTLDINGISFISKKFPRERAEYAMKKYLEDLKYNQWKIIIADVNDDVARTVMCEAYKLNMTAQHGYVWFLPLWLSETWYNTTYYNIVNNESINCTSEMMLEAINGHLGLTHAFFASNNSIMQENITVSEWRKKYTSICQLNTEPSNYAGYAYDAVWTYAIALDKLIKQDPEAISKIHSPDITDKLVNIIQQTDFNGVSGRIKFYDGPSRYSIIHIVQWINYTTKIVGSYYPDISNNTHKNGNLNLNLSEINWFLSNAKIPDDGTKPPHRCVLEGLAELLNVECEVAVIIANIIGFGFLVAILVIALYIVKRKYDQKVLLTQKYMRSLGIDLLNTSSMDKWEIQRDQVVINRKLGEGAFGTVYGGEAHFDDRGWVGVAVKTLKIGSTTEEKLDFLSEAEIMKRFDHKNIVKLLGVCTQCEPVYTIMEFMLYGDLKTFLLARRHLVNDRSTEDNDEISSKKLTSMALDIARALSYLAEMKFVHRDVACRNCLLNAQRMVKLGDFGMTRPMFENDYYKFNRKGMLPVRWMAPESLSLGIFTPSTDVWSYGVLLYEIITFGSFPFQGMSNYQVLEHVKEGNALKIPSAVKPQLEELIKSCWNLEQKYRPSASEIVEFLANNPRLLSPCLDAPLSSVQIEEINHELEMQLPESFRKFSVDPKINQNQITSPSLCTLPPVSVRQESISNAVISDIESIPLEHSCVKEPLLGSPFSQYDSENEHNKFVTLKQHDDYLDTDAYGVHALSVL